VLEVGNLDEQVTALRECTALPSLAIKRTKGLRRWVKIRTGGGQFCRWGRIPADGNHLCGFTKLRAHVRVHGRVVRLRLVERYTGTRAGKVAAIGSRESQPGAHACRVKLPNRDVGGDRIPPAHEMW
jgi:hypothetical protein